MYYRGYSSMVLADNCRNFIFDNRVTILLITYIHPLDSCIYAPLFAFKIMTMQVLYFLYLFFFSKQTN